MREVSGSIQLSRSKLVSTTRKSIANVSKNGGEFFDVLFRPNSVGAREYTAPQYLERLRSRGLGARRLLALREFALGVEAWQRFLEREPPRRVHECTFAVLALESEPVDPRP